MSRFLPAAALLGLLAQPAAAEMPTVRSLRQLAIEADTVVVAAPAVPAAPGRFRAVRVLQGTALHSGDVFEVDRLWKYDPAQAADPPHGEEKGKSVRIAEALLFLGPRDAGGDGTHFPQVFSGVRYWTAEGKYISPEGSLNVVVPWVCRSGVDWGELLDKTAEDLAQVQQVRRLKAIADPERRDRGLLEWVERRRYEFGGGTSIRRGVEPAGWGSLETDVFAWVLESHIPEDCWSAVKLYAELNHGDAPPLRVPAFGSRAGRALLLKVALDDDALLGHRIRALDLLANPLTLWPKPQDGTSVEPLDAKEQADLLDRLTPLLNAPTAPHRIAVARILRGASRPADEAFKSLHTDRVLPALTVAYRIQPPGAARDELAEAVCVVGGPANWQQLSGNPDGLVFSLRDPGCREEDRVYFWLAMRQGRAEVHACPLLVLERLDDKGKVVEKKEMPLPATSPPAWEAAGWLGDSYLYTPLSLKDFTPGTWQMTVKGVVGKEKTPWSSEPRRLHLAPAPKPEEPHRPRVVFDE